MADDLRAQRLGDGGAGVQEVDIDAARPVMARRLHLLQMAILGGPADLPVLQLADGVHTFLAQQPGEAFVAQTAPGGQRVLQMVRPVILGLLADGGGNGHLCHHRGAAASDQAAVDEDGAAARFRGGDGGGHSGPACTDDRDVGFKCAHKCMMAGFDALHNMLLMQGRMRARESGGVPGVQQGNPHRREVRIVTRCDGQAMDKGGGGDYRIAVGPRVGDVQARTLAGDGGVDGENAALKGGKNMVVDPAPEDISLRLVPSGDKADTDLDFQDGDGGQVKKL